MYNCYRNTASGRRSWLVDRITKRPFLLNLFLWARIGMDLDEIPRDEYVRVFCYCFDS